MKTLSNQNKSEQEQKLEMDHKREVMKEKKT